jgi:hypothetical protein
MGSLESFWYELSPYVYSAGGVLALTSASSGLGLASGALLLASAAVILSKRRSYRSALRSNLRARSAKRVTARSKS